MSNIGGQNLIVLKMDMIWTEFCNSIDFFGFIEVV